MLAHKTKNHESNDLECIIQNKLFFFFFIDKWRMMIQTQTLFHRRNE